MAITTSINSKRQSAAESVRSDYYASKSLTHAFVSDDVPRADKRKKYGIFSNLLSRFSRKAKTSLPSRPTASALPVYLGNLSHQQMVAGLVSAGIVSAPEGSSEDQGNSTSCIHPRRISEPSYYPSSQPVELVNQETPRYPGRQIHAEMIQSLEVTSIVSVESTPARATSLPVLPHNHQPSPISFIGDDSFMDDLASPDDTLSDDDTLVSYSTPTATPPQSPIHPKRLSTTSTYSYILPMQYLDYELQPPAPPIAVRPASFYQPKPARVELDISKPAIDALELTFVQNGNRVKNRHEISPPSQPHSTLLTSRNTMKVVSETNTDCHMYGLVRSLDAAFQRQASKDTAKMPGTRNPIPPLTMHPETANNRVATTTDWAWR